MTNSCSIIALACLVQTACLDLGALQDHGGLPSYCEAMVPDQEYVRCAGRFAAGQAAGLCPAGYALAGGAMPAGLRAACAAISGSFFAADVGSWNDAVMPLTGAVSCSPAGNKMPGLMGCGDEKNAISPAMCSGWPRSIICSRSQEWTCLEGTLRSAANTNPNHGVVCVRR